MKLRPARYPAIIRLEERFNRVFSLLSQEHQEYGPYVFGYYLQGNGPCRHQLYFKNTQTGVLTLLEMILDRKPVERFRMTRLVVKSDLGPLGEICTCLMSNIVRESVPVKSNGTDVRFLFSWDWTGRLSELRTYSRFDELGRNQKQEEIGHIEKRAEMHSPWRVKMGLKAAKIVNLSGVLPLLDTIYANTPCEMCSKTFFEHTVNSLDHEYKPFMVTNFYRTPCLDCGNTIQTHSNMDHQYNVGLPPYIDVLSDWPEEQS